MAKEMGSMIWMKQGTKVASPNTIDDMREILGYPSKKKDRDSKSSYDIPPRYTGKMEYDVASMKSMGLNIEQEKAIIRCFVCRKETTKCCARCRSAYYCCKEHQVNDWETHKKACTNM